MYSNLWLSVDYGVGNENQIRLKGTSENLISENTIRLLHLCVVHNPYEYIQK